jgi:predicted neutral ceramidase superfamily lipid hydrolase
MIGLRASGSSFSSLISTFALIKATGFLSGMRSKIFYAFYSATASSAFLVSSSCFFNSASYYLRASSANYLAAASLIPATLIFSNLILSA